MRLYSGVSPSPDRTAHHTSVPESKFVPNRAFVGAVSEMEEPDTPALPLAWPPRASVWAVSSQRRKPGAEPLSAAFLFSSAPCLLLPFATRLSCCKFLPAETRVLLLEDRHGSVLVETDPHHGLASNAGIWKLNCRSNERI